MKNEHGMFNSTCLMLNEISARVHAFARPVQVDFVSYFNECGLFLPPFEHSSINYQLIFSEFLYKSVCYQVTQHDPIIPVKQIRFIKKNYKKKKEEKFSQKTR